MGRGLVLSQFPPSSRGKDGVEEIICFAETLKVAQNTALLSYLEDTRHRH